MPVSLLMLLLAGAAPHVTMAQAPQTQSQQAPATPGGALLRYVPAEHNAVAFVNPGTVMASPLYARLKADPAFRPVQRQITGLEAATGLNAQRDLAEAVWSGLLTDPERRFVVVARGRIDQAALVKRFQAAPQYQTTSHRGRACHAWLDRQNNRLMHGAFPADGVLIMSDSPTTLRHALDAGTDTAQSIQKFAKTRVLASRIAPQSAAWFLALRSGVMPAEVYNNPMLNNLQGAVWSARLSERIDMTIHGELPDAQTAQQYRMMVEGMLAMTRFMGDDPALQALAQSAAVSHAGTGVAVRMSATPTEAAALIRQAMEME